MTSSSQMWGSRSACGLLPCICISIYVVTVEISGLGRPSALIQAHLRGRKEGNGTEMQMVICGLIQGASPSALFTLWLNFLSMGRISEVSEGRTWIQRQWPLFIPMTH